MTNPVLIEVTRGDLVESQHRGTVAIVGGGGALHLGLGATDLPVFPRSAVKIFQALPLVESGAADAFGLSDAELALACASHDGEEGHVACAHSILSKVGLDESALACGTQWPARGEDQDRIRRAGKEPSAAHNNCSGKHAGFLCACVHNGWPVEGYETRDHPLQRQIHDILEEMTGATLSDDVCAIDGCSIPTWAIPPERLALAFARAASGRDLSEQRMAALTRLRKACAAHPFEVDATGGFCTEVMTRFREKVYVKVGAEGVFCAALPDRKLGVAIKIDDGGTRGSEAAMATVLQALLAETEEDRAFLDRWARTPVETRRGVKAGTVRPGDDFSHAIRKLEDTSAC
ncbi:asparaginase [Amorphus orientalis]|uniref:L-asparaginase II n=1 Tax=Amorphus orientalis TaxID=649198 RepID=A0AAE3VPS7_9HYPH|nr:asparaginase [Amorphus orientalis]MDQ0315862.1 L-asparaginase II [Amorphus orientalis]